MRLQNKESCKKSGGWVCQGARALHHPQPFGKALGMLQSSSEESEVLPAAVGGGYSVS